MTIKPFIAANWKMHKLPSEASKWASECVKALDNNISDDVMIAICAPATHLLPLSDSFANSPVSLGAQDVSVHKQGAYTGEISTDMLVDAGVTYVIVGHSERRAYHNETDELVRSKVAATLEDKLVPILCVGETLEQREAGNAKDVTISQLRGGLKDITLAEASELVVAYEPVWAIGTGKTATAEDAQEMCGAIRAELKTLYPEIADSMHILYGGSMKAANAAELIGQLDINGGLVGSASLTVDSMVALVEAARS